jgi:integrase
MDSWKFTETVNASYEYKDGVISNEDIIKILDYCKEQRQAANTNTARIRWFRREISIRLGWEMGFRSCEYGNTKFGEVDKNGRITIKNSKHNGTRIIAVTKETRDVILEFKCLLQELKLMPTGDGVFEKLDGRIYSTSTFRRWLKKVANACNILDKQAKTHGLRHRFARNFYSHARDEFMLADIMGHKSTATTRVYASKTFEEVRDTIQSANDIAKQPNKIKAA